MNGQIRGVNAVKCNELFAYVNNNPCNLSYFIFTRIAIKNLEIDEICFN